MLAEKAIYPQLSLGGAKIIEAIGYAAGSEIPVFTLTYATDGTLSAPGSVPAPGDCAALVRYATAARSTKNHPIYLFNYYHAVMAMGTAAGSDTLLTGQRTAMSTYAAAWITGFSDGSLTLVRSGPQAEAATGELVATLLTHRDLPR